MLLMMILLGIVTVAAGRTIGDSGSIGYYVVAAIFILIGLDMLDVITLPWFGMHKEQVQRKGVKGAVLLGLVFGLASGPCTFAFLAPILAVTFHAASSNAWFGGLLLLAFGIGHCIILLLAGASAERAKRLAEWQRRTNTARHVRMVFGLLLVLGGLYFLYRAL
jgi:cytochrome c-type biogenesis protein